jgi:glycerol-3-phosphate acyltransferase PlsY
VLNEMMLVLAAYFLGSIPTGLLLAKAFGVDIRTTGSGNIGATNVYRTLGRNVGIMTLAGDCLKGLIPVVAANYLEFPVVWIALAGLAAFLGHVYTVFLGFKGGKGVATALGVFLGVSPLSVLIALAIFSLVLWKWRYISLASITAAVTIPVVITLIAHNTFFTLMSIIIATIIVHKHQENIDRLKAGTESRFKG